MQKVLLIEMTFVFWRHSLKFDHLNKCGISFGLIHGGIKSGERRITQKINPLSINVRLEPFELVTLKDHGSILRNFSSCNHDVLIRQMLAEYGARD